MRCRLCAADCALLTGIAPINVRTSDALVILTFRQQQQQHGQSGQLDCVAVASLMRPSGPPERTGHDSP